MSDDRKLCFVVMGFGKKTDFETGRTLDLDATFEAIIQPAAEAAGLRCIRADDILHSGLIDRPMYEMLLRANLVIADISTGNVNAVYELGVRHALRPNATIVMKEKEGRLSFDLNHVSTFKYEHLGDDIGAREAIRASRELGALIAEVLSASAPDSPVYSFLPTLQRPRLSDEQFAELLDDKEEQAAQLASYVKAGEQARDADHAGHHDEAARAFAAAAAMKPGDPYLLQQLALTTYKSKQPSELAALNAGLDIISSLHPDNSNDPETLGIAGAIHKRLWLLTNDRAELEAAIRHYGRGFEVRRDYYTGENLAICFDLRSDVQADPAEALFDRMSARKVREHIIEILDATVASPSFADRSDRRWVYATLAACSFAIGADARGARNEALFFGEGPKDWEVETYDASKQLMIARAKG